MFLNTSKGISGKCRWQEKQYCNYEGLNYFNKNRLYRKKLGSNREHSRILTVYYKILRVLHFSSSTVYRLEWKIQTFFRKVIHVLKSNNNGWSLQRYSLSEHFFSTNPEWTSRISSLFNLMINEISSSSTNKIIQRKSWLVYAFNGYSNL